MADRYLVKRLGWLLLALLPGILSASESIDTRPAFDQLLDSTGLQIAPSQSYIDLGAQHNDVLPYEHAMRHDSGELEIRFIVRPLDRIEIEYNDPHNAAPEPNHLFPLLFESITNRLAVSRDAPTSTFPADEAKALFNASWAAAAAFSVDPGYANGYHNAVLIAMHKSEVADAYTLFLYNDHERAKPLIGDSVSILSFASDTQ